MIKQKLAFLSIFASTLMYGINYEKLAITHALLLNNSQLPLNLIITTKHDSTQTQDVVTIPPHGRYQKKYTGIIRSICDNKNTPIEPSHIIRDPKHNIFRIMLENRQKTHERSDFFMPPYHPFNTSMGTHYDQCLHATSGKYLTATKPEHPKVLLSLFETLYEAYHPTKVVPSNQTRIPKIIHQIWLGSKLPDKFKAWQQSWLDRHKDWQFILWTDQKLTHNPDFITRYSHYSEQSLASFGTLFNQRMYDMAPNYGAKADIVRIELLHRYGGLYTDVDTEACEKFDILNHCYDFYAGIEPLEFLWLSLNNGIIGSIAGHPILDRYMRDIHEKSHFPRAWQTTHLTTGPIAFTKAFWAVAIHDKNHINIAFPARYFGPIDRFNTITMWHETYAKQYFTHSWIG